MKNITVPKEFFRNERNNIYGNWKTAFWRELISNSLDAGADRIHIRTRFDGDRLMVDFVDNGSGMSRDIVENVYMSLGETTKAGDNDSVGGFGRARILMCFGQDSYTIRTRDIFVRGNGASYEILAAGKETSGTAITIGIDDTYPSSLQRALRNVLQQSSIRAAVTLDLVAMRPTGEDMPLIDAEMAPLDPVLGRQRFRAWSRKGRPFGDLADSKGIWGSLYVNAGAQALKGRAIVRVSGMAMYDEHISEHVQVTVDLDPARAREVLTASRDSIRPAFRDELQKVFNRISADRTATFKENAREPESELARTGAHAGPLLIRGRDKPKTPAAPQFTMSRPAPERPDLLEPAEAPAPFRDDAPAAARRPSVMTDDAATGARLVMRTLRLDVATRVENPTAQQRAARRRYDPSTWAGQGSEGRTAELLHAAWTAACRHALGVLVDMHPHLADEEWVSGFIFDSQTLGQHREIHGVRHALLVKSVDDAGRMRYQISDPVSMKRMVSVAIHEVCHCVHDWHDESYAGLLTRMMGEIRDRDIEAEIKAELVEARAWIDNRAKAYEGKIDSIPKDRIEEDGIPAPH